MVMIGRLAPVYLTTFLEDTMPAFYHQATTPHLVNDHTTSSKVDLHLLSLLHHTGYHESKRPFDNLQQTAYPLEGGKNQRFD